MYWSDDGDLIALRVDQWKVHFLEQRADGLDVWREPFVRLRAPKIFNLRSDPFERADFDATMSYDKWMADRAFLLVPAQAIVAEYLKTFENFPPRQKPASFTLMMHSKKRANSRQTWPRPLFACACICCHAAFFSASAFSRFTSGGVQVPSRISFLGE